MRIQKVSSIILKSHVGTHDELLNECRRCPQRIVQIANVLIGRNQRLAPKGLNPCAQNGQGEVFIVQHNSVTEEIQTLAEYIDWYLQNHAGMPAGEVLLLANRRMIGNGIRDELNEKAQQHQRPWTAQSFYFEDALDTQLAADGFSLLTMLVDPEDRPALRYWLGSDAQDCRSRPYSRLRQYCEQNGQSPRMVLDALAAGTLRLAYTGPLVNRFTELQQRLAVLLPMDVPQLIDSLFADGNPDLALIRQIALLVAPNVANIREFVSELRVAVTQPELPGPQGNAVRIMSLHKSKGLTARLVVIAGCVSGIIPSIDFQAPLAEQNRQREEQRRLFYVGITRTTETLVLSNAVRMPFAAALQMRMPVAARRGAYAMLQASPFLAELGPAAPARVSGANWRAQVGF